MEHFRSLFGVAVGLLVLVGSIVKSQYQQLKKSVLQKTAGVSRRQVAAMVPVAYLVLIRLSELAGVVLSVGAAAMLSTCVIVIRYLIALSLLIGVSVLAPALAVAPSLISNRGIDEKTALELLRTEA